MLIAIMGDTFERIIENRDINATKTKLELMADVVSGMRQTTKEEEKEVFVFVVKPVDDDDVDGNEWEGTINKMTRITQRNIEALGNKIHKKSDKIQASIDDFVKQDNVKNRHLRQYVDLVVKSQGKEVKDDVKTLSKRMDEMQGDMKKVQAEMQADMKEVQADVKEILKSLRNKEGAWMTSASHK